MKAVRYKTRVFYRLLMMMVGLIALQAVADDFSQIQKPRVFTLADNKAVTLKVLNWNPQRKHFQVENSKGKKVWISPAAFTDKGQAYLKEWISAHNFLSNNKLYIAAKREAKGGYVFYKLSIHNKTSVDYTKVLLKYEVERIRENYEAGKQENKNVPGKLFVGTIKAGSHKTFKTQPVRAGETYKTVYSPTPVKIRSGVSFTYTHDVPHKTGREKVNGIRLKFQGPKLDGVQIIREVYIDK